MKSKILIRCIVLSFVRSCSVCWLHLSSGGRTVGGVGWLREQPVWQSGDRQDGGRGRVHQASSYADDRPRDRGRGRVQLATSWAVSWLTRSGEENGPSCNQLGRKPTDKIRGGEGSIEQPVKLTGDEQDWGRRIHSIQRVQKRCTNMSNGQKLVVKSF